MTTIELYYSDTCKECHQLRKLLIQIIPKNMKFKEINISYPEGMHRARELNISSVPAIVIDGAAILFGRISKNDLLNELNLRK